MVIKQRPTFLWLHSGARRVSAALAVLLVATWLAARASGAEYSLGVLIRVEGVITPMLEQYCHRKLAEAQKRGADLVILEIDSPGGYLLSSWDIAERVRQLGWAHTVAFVPREALSGAAIVALACDEIFMDPQARLGDAGPIVVGEDGLFRHAPEKTRSDLATRMQGLAKAKGRPPALAEAMVDSQLVVFHVKNRASGEQTIMSAREISSSGNPDQWEKIKPVLESGGGRFLEVVGARAVELGLAQGAAKDREELTRRCGLKGQLEILEPTAVDTAVYILNLRLVTGLLLVIGLVALYIEFSAPGISVGGLIAGLCFALFFWSRFLGGTAGALEVLLFLAGVVFLCVEFFVLPGFGVAGLSGILLVVASLILACQTFVIPTTANQLASFGDGLLVVIGSGAAFAAAAVALTHYLGAIPLLNRLTLGAPPAGGQSPGGGDASSSAAASGRDRRKVQVGDCGVAESPLRPAGKAMFGLEYIDVVTDGSFVEKGRPVRVVEVSGNRVVVREVEEA